MIQGQDAQKQREVMATYPIAFFLLFVFLAGVSVYMQNKASDHVVQDDIVQDIKKEPVSEKSSVPPPAILAKKDDPITRVRYQPIKKDNAADLVLVNASSGIVLDVGSGTILWEKNSTERRSIASTTKLVTAMIVIDRVQNLDEQVIVPPSVMNIEGTKVGCPTSVICNSPRLQIGEQVSVRDLLKATLMYSANDAATLLGIHIAGSEEAFAELMNVRMRELGAGNTHFCRPSGLELDVNEELCYSSAYDIARVAAHLLQHDKYDVLWDIMRIPDTTFTSADGMIVHELDNTNRLLDTMPNLIGAKTGFTPRAGYCLVLASVDPTDEHHIVSVVLDDIERFNDVEKMSAWAFDSFAWK